MSAVNQCYMLSVLLGYSLSALVKHTGRSHWL